MNASGSPEICFFDGFRWFSKLHFDQQDTPGVAPSGGYAAGSCIGANATDAIRQLLGKEARFQRTVQS